LPVDVFSAPYKLVLLAAAACCVSLALISGQTPSPVAMNHASSDTADASVAKATHRGWAAPERDEAVDVRALASSLVEQGRAALAAGDLEKGFEAYRRAADYDPSAETHGLVGDLYLRMAVRSEAEFHLRRAADLEPENPDRWLALANAHFLKSDLGAAWKAIDRAKQADPTIDIERDANNFVVRGRAG
jgi:tetratricopeptide (TPR) repeat protein